MADFLKIIGTALGLFFVISQLSWWFSKKYFPSIRLCMWVHRNAANWLTNEHKRLKEMDQPTVFGLLCALLLFGIVPLNVTILAQVFDIFVPPGEIITLPFIDSYGTFPLLVGLLFALTELAFSALMEQKRKLNQRTVFISIVIAAMILVEAGLNFYRGIIIEVDDAVMQTFWDKLIGFGGPTLAAFIGIVVPLAMVLLGAFAIIDFMIPVLRNIFILTRFVFSSMFIYLGILLFGWHPSNPVQLPSPITRLRDKVKELKEEAVSLTEKLKQLKEMYPEVEAAKLQDPNELEKEIFELENQLINEETRFLNGSNYNGNGFSPALSTAFAYVNCKSDLRGAIRGTKTEIRDFYTKKNSMEHEFEKLSEQLLNINKNGLSYNHKLNVYAKLFDAAEQQYKALVAQITKSKIVELCDCIDMVIKLETCSGSSLSEAETSDFIQIINPPSNLPKEEREWRKSIADTCKAIVQEANGELIKIQTTVNEAGEWLEIHRLSKPRTPVAMSDHRQSIMEKKLVDIDNRIQKLEKNNNDRFNELQIQLREIAIQLRAVIIWLNLLVKIPKRV